MQMLPITRNYSETRHSYQSTQGDSLAAAARSTLSSKAMQNSRGRRGHRLKPPSENSVAGVGGPVSRVESRQKLGAPPEGVGGSRSDDESLLMSFNQAVLLYAMCLTLFGLVFPLSKYVSIEPFSAWYLCGFYIFIYSVSIAFLIFFMTWIMTRPPYTLFVNGASTAQKSMLVKLEDSERPSDQVEFRVGRFSVSESNQNFKAGSAGDGEEGCPNNGFDAGDEAAEASEAGDLPQIVLHEASRVEMPSDDENSLPGGLPNVRFEEMSPQTSVNDTVSKHNASYMRRINSTLFKNAKEFGVHEIQSYSVLSLHESHSPSFFLRVACFLFGGLKTAHDILHIVDDLTDLVNNCASYTVGGNILQSFLSITFTSLQTFFIFKYSKVSANIYQEVSAFGFMHLVATNMCVWFEAILLETSHYSHDDDSHAYDGSHNGSASNVTTPAAAVSTCSKQVFWKMAPYLFPFTIEYSLMAAFSCYVLYSNVGKFLEVIKTKGFNIGKKCLRNRKKTQTSFNASCYKSDKGFFFGALQMIVGLVSGIYFTIYVAEEGETRIVSKYIFLITDILLLVCNFALCVLAYLSIRKLTLVHKLHMGPDSWLLGITLMGVVAFELFLLFGSASEVIEFRVLRVLKGILVLLQSIFQVFLVFDGEKRRARTEEAIEQKPGREMIAALLLGNLALWVVYTLEVREIYLPKLNAAYVTIASQIFSYVCSPLIIFFRFHSACCFVEIWRHAYKSKDGRRPACQHAQVNHGDKQAAKDADTASIHFPGSLGDLQSATVAEN